MDALLLQIVTGCVTSGIAYGAVKTSLNGTVARTVRLENKMDELVEHVGQIRTDVAVLKAQGE